MIFADALTGFESLKRRSPYWPGFINESDDKCMRISSIVRIERDGFMYGIHLVESQYIAEQPIDLMTFMKRVINHVHEIQTLYNPKDTDIDTNQISEKDRLILNMK